MSPVPYTWGPFLAKIFLKIDEIKIRPLTPPQNHFNTLPVLVADACIQEGWEKKMRVCTVPKLLVTQLPENQGRDGRKKTLVI